MLKKIVIKNLDDLKEHIKRGVPSFYFSSQTSTVIPYDKIEKYLDTKNEFHMCDLSQMPDFMNLLENGNLIIRGAVNWKDARDYLRPKGRNIKTSPTEELALIIAGVATSCTGERCFHFGNLRSQIKRIKYVNNEGNEIELHSHKKIDFSSNHLLKYQSDFSHYSDYKNAPFPRFETQTDLMTGTEGQLGIITEIEMETTEDFRVSHLFMLIPKWEVDSKAHIEIIQKIQSFREEIILCELIDANAFSFLPNEEQPNKGQDAIFLEIKSEEFENIYERFILDLNHVEEKNIFELTESKFHKIRASIPRAVFEENSSMGVTKMGTDIQVTVDKFPKLLEIYKRFSNLGIRYNLFGHFGDAHLHFNFMPKNTDIESCQKQFKKMYDEVAELKGSPFAEHGIGLIKQKYIKKFWNDNQTNLFHELKKKYDPKSQFFPQGYMNLK